MGANKIDNQTYIFGELLKAYRKRRGWSQLDLSIAAKTTPRYISFIETGRSRAGRKIVLRVATALNLTLRDSNSLLIAAGFSAAYSENTLEEDTMSPVRRVVDQILKKHNPYPAWAIAPGLNFIQANKTAELVYPGLCQMSPMQLIDAWCAPTEVENEALRQEAVANTISALRHEMFHHPHPDLSKLMQHAESHAEGVDLDSALYVSPVMCPTLMVGEQAIKTLSTVMRFDKAADVTMAEIRLELIFPADEEGEKAFLALAV